MNITTIKYPKNDTDVLINKIDTYDEGIMLSYHVGTSNIIRSFFVNDEDLCCPEEGITIVYVQDNSYSCIEFIFNGISTDAYPFYNRTVEIAYEHELTSSVINVKDDDEPEYSDDYLKFGDLWIRCDMITLTSGPYAFMN